MLDKRLLTNIAKGATVWSLSTAIIASPALIFGPNHAQSYLFGCVAMGGYVPLLMLAGTKFRGARDVADFYITIYDVARDKMRDVFKNSSIKTK